MKGAGIRCWGAGLALTTGLVVAPAHAAGPDILITDVEAFYRIYDAASGRPTAAELERDYIAVGSSGLREFIPNRIISGENLATQISENPDIYARARNCASALPIARERLSKAFETLSNLYPAARFPPVTVVIGGANSGGTTGPTGALIGLEVVCSTVHEGETVADRLTHLIAHEYGHVQQVGPAKPTVLEASLAEGVAELMAELTTGRILNDHLITWTRGREAEIGAAFLNDADSYRYSGWLYNGLGTPKKPGDLGYWLGWRIAKKYYEAMPNKRAALSELIALKDPKAILRKSRWKPGD